ncbi:MAG TPA: sugar transferase [Solirubrobacteraceae bacterium]|nr:sugar transferase [Solirubrobacteraceae bacterium]
MAEVRSQTPQAERTTRSTPSFAATTTETPQRPRPKALAVKHVLDRILAACGLLVTAPLFAGVALALHYRGADRVLRRDQRIGEHARFIYVRSFVVTDEMVQRSRGWRIVAGTGMTALPQLWSVLRGEQSIVGPRPRELGFEPPPMRPGLTGLAQLEQLERWLSLAEQLALDDEYARRWSLLLDARIAWRTMWSVLR